MDSWYICFSGETNDSWGMVMILTCTRSFWCDAIWTMPKKACLFLWSCKMSIVNPQDLIASGQRFDVSNRLYAHGPCLQSHMYESIIFWVVRLDPLFVLYAHWHDQSVKCIAIHLTLAIMPTVHWPWQVRLLQMKRLRDCAQRMWQGFAALQAGPRSLS